MSHVFYHTLKNKLKNLNCSIQDKMSTYTDILYKSKEPSPQHAVKWNHIYLLVFCRLKMVDYSQFHLVQLAQSQGNYSYTSLLENYYSLVTVIGLKGHETKPQHEGFWHQNHCSCRACFCTFMTIYNFQRATSVTMQCYAIN